MKRTLEIVLEFKKRLLERFGEAKVMLFGSRVRGMLKTTRI